MTFLTHKRPSVVWQSAGILSLVLLCWQSAWAGEPFRGHSLPYVELPANQTAPEVPFITPQGEAKTLSTYQGQVVVLNFWASWCPACLAEMASLQRLKTHLADESVRVVTLNQDLNNSAEISQLLTSLGAPTLPAYRDSSSLLGMALGQTLLPTTLIIDPQGRLVGQLLGPASWDSPEAEQLIRRYLN